MFSRGCIIKSLIKRPHRVDGKFLGADDQSEKKAEWTRHGQKPMVTQRNPGTRASTSRNIHQNRQKRSQGSTKQRRGGDAQKGKGNRPSIVGGTFRGQASRRLRNYAKRLANKKGKSPSAGNRKSEKNNLGEIVGSRQGEERRTKKGRRGKKWEGDKYYISTRRGEKLALFFGNTAKVRCWTRIGKKSS